MVRFSVITLCLLFLFGSEANASKISKRCIVGERNKTFIPPADDEKNLYNELKLCIDHANRLVRENNFIGSELFYKRAFCFLDSIEKKDIKTIDNLDSLSRSLKNHYSNFQYIKISTNYKEEDQAFYYRLQDSKANKSDIVKPIVIDDNKKVNKYIDYYSNKAKRSFFKIYQRSFPYINEIKKIFKSYGLPDELSYLPFVESSYNPFAHSYSYASGLWQFMDSTGEIYGLSKNWWEDDRKNIHKSTVAAAKHLKDLYKRFEDWNLVLAAYNAGSANVSKKMKRHKTKDYWKLWKLPKETKKYVPKFHAVSAILNNFENYGLEDYSKEMFVYDSLQLDSCVSLKAIADASNMSYEEVKKLNPHLRQWCLPPYAKNYPVMIPAISKIDARRRLSALVDSLKYSSVDIAYNSEKISDLAKKFKINKEAIYNLNKDFTKNSIKIVVPPIKDEWFVNFNKKFLSFYDNESYFLDCQKKVNYRVKRGDSLWKISRMFNVNMKKLKGWNKIGSRGIIKPGQRLVIYL
ncbi:MAG: hypothetical protein CR982_00745 [Candidatus Cloacimonadota bacterium]|nr:MAG: hypothetical protein CR982_00745 [Candidatus Cloacimonadota bacterium]PIE79763.1 MAG: hypothetical protein CSA15_02650 [Candidatus Delongbacteria bacterium]